MSTLVDDDNVDDSEFVTAAVSPASTCGGTDIEECRKLLADVGSSPSSGVKCKLSITTTTDPSTSEYDTAPAHRKVPSFNDAHSTASPSSVANGSIQLDSITEDYVSVITTTPATPAELWRQSSSSDGGAATTFWHPNYLTPRKVDHPLHDSIVKGIFKSIGQCMAAIFVGIPLMFLILLFLAVAIPLRVLFYVVTRLSIRKLYRSVLHKRHCYPLWPLSSRRLGSSNVSRSDHSMFMATLEGGLDPADVRQMIWRKLINAKDEAGYLIYVKLSQLFVNGSWIQDDKFDISNHVKIVHCQSPPRHHVTPPGAEPKRSTPAPALKTLKDLEKFLTDFSHEPFNLKRPLWSAYILHEFGESHCTLLVWKMHSHVTDRCLCPAKLICALNDETLRFDMSPHTRRDGSALPLFVSMSMFAWRYLNVCGSGLCDFVAHACRRPMSTNVWNILEKQQKQQHSSCCWNVGGVAGSRQVSVHGQHQQHVVGGPLRGSLTNHHNRQCNKLTWARVPSADQLIRVERILRCTTEELLMSFIGGAIRRFFRSRGIKHPPDVWVSVPVTFRDFMSVNKGQECDVALVPVKLPTDIDGVVPRVWESQRRLYNVVDSALPRTVKCLSIACGHLTPKSWTSKLVALPHRSCDGFVCFYRSGGEMSFCRRRIYSVLMYSSMSEPMCHSAGKFGFTFVQIGHEIVLSLSVDSIMFPDPDVLIQNFQAELHSLLKLLQPRMLTLSQATFLPMPLMNRKCSNMAAAAQTAVDGDAGGRGHRRVSSIPMIDDLNSDLVAAANRESEYGYRFAADQHNVRIHFEQSRPQAQRAGVDSETNELSESVFDDAVESESESVEELEALLATVQNELLHMESNPKGNRSDYINKLALLELKMEAFHRNITTKLEKSGRPVPRTPDGRELDAKPAWDTVLQPYKNDTGELNADALREGLAIYKRRRSKRLSSPTRFSHEGSEEYLSEIP